MILIPADLAKVTAILEAPDYRRTPLPGTQCARTLGITPAAVSNLAARPHTGVKRYKDGYDIWEIQRWLLMRDATKVRNRRVALT